MYYRMVIRFKEGSSLQILLSVASKGTLKSKISGGTAKKAMHFLTMLADFLMY